MGHTRLRRRESFLESRSRYTVSREITVRPENNHHPIYWPLGIQGRDRVSRLTENTAVSMYLDDSLAAGLGRRRRAQLAVLHRRFPGPFNAKQAAQELGTAIGSTRRLLAALATGGWLARVRPGWYIAVPLAASEPSEWREDPWIVAATLFAPGYIGGWSAAEHWGLTDQIFSVVYVVAGKRVTPSRQSHSGYRLHHSERGHRDTVRDTASLAPDRCPSMCPIRIAPSSIFSTYPPRPEVRCMQPKSSCTYFESADADPARLLQYGDRLGRGTVFKRLGYLAERQQLADASFISACRSRITRGLSWLDPAGPRNGRIVSRWNLRVNSARLAPDN